MPSLAFSTPLALPHILPHILPSPTPTSLRPSPTACAPPPPVPAPPVPAPPVPARGANAARLARYLAADWHNPSQSQDKPQFFAHIHATFRPLPNSLFNGYAFYTESAYDYNIGLPYKTSVVLIAAPATPSETVLELVSYKLEAPEEFMLGAHEKELLEPLTKAMLRPLSCACNTVYVWVEEEGGYVGFSRPGKECIIRRGGKERATYLDSKITLGETSYKPWDTGRDLETDERVWGGVLGPFDFIAKTRFDDEVSDVFEDVDSPMLSSLLP